MNLEELKNYINKENLKMINSILKDSELNDIDKKNAFEISWYLKNKTSHYYIHKESIIKLFFDVCMDKEIRTKSCFSKLLNIIRNEIQDIENPQFDNRYSDKNLKKESENKQLLFNKIYTSMFVAINIKDYNDHDFFEIINKILKSNVNHDYSDFITKIIENDIIKNNPEKLKIIFEVLLIKKIHIPYVKDYDIYQNIINILTNEDTLKLDNDNYKKIVEIIIFEFGSYILDNSLQYKNLTHNKKIAIINYFNKMKNYFPTPIYYLHDLKEEKNIKKMSIFNLACSDRLLSMDDDTYDKTLEDISNCNKPFSYAVIQSNNDLTEKQRNFVCELIKQGEVKNKEKKDDLSIDYKKELAHIAVSPIILKLNFEEYKQLLTIINKYCEEVEKLENQNLDKWIVYLWNKRNVAELIDKHELYSENQERLLFTINEMLSSKKRSVSDSITKFSTNENSVYYNEEEYQEIIQLIKSRGFEYSICELFINENVPFIEDKKTLFAIAYSNSSEYIDSYTKKLNDTGRYNMNLYLAFNEIDEKTINLIKENHLFKIKKIIK